MPSVKQRTKGPVFGDKGKPVTDEEILKDRRKLEAFDKADTFLGKMVGLGLWAVATAWFLYFVDITKVIESSLHRGSSDALLTLSVAGGYCRGLSQASPRSWSSWRFSFHLAWCPVFGLLALIFFMTATTGPASTPGNLCWGLTFGCAAAAGLAVLTIPGSSPGAAKAIDSAMGRMLIFGDGIAGLALGASIVAGTEWSEKLGLLTTLVTALPLFPVAAGFCLSSTEAECLVAVPTAMTFYVGASLRSFYFGGFWSAIPPAILFFVHAGLYLPIDAENNPFWQNIVRQWRGFMSMMSSPSSGFGDD